MDLFLSLFCLLLTVVYKIDAIYILTEKEYTWSQATQICTLATPNLNFNENGTTPDLDASYGADVWLGYTETLTPFEYFGCARKYYLDLNTADFLTEGDPGKCWSACNSSNYTEAVAVSDNECYCLRVVSIDIIRLLNGRCDTRCPSQPSIVCGGKIKFVSLYKTTYTGPIATSATENNQCVWYDSTTSTFFWGKCTENYRIICYKGREFPITDNNVWVYTGYTNYGDWITMTTMCFSDVGIPSNYNNTKDLITTERNQMWTGIIRSGVTDRNSGSTNDNERKYGYFNIETGKLSFTNNDTVTKRALCVKGTFVTDKTSTSTETISHVTDSLSEDSPNIGIIVGVTLSIAVIIIVSVVIAVLWKRGVRKRKSEHQQERTVNHAGYENSALSIPQFSAHGYEEVDVTTIPPGNSMSLESSVNNSRNNYDEAHTYRNIDINASNIQHTYSNIDNKHGKGLTYQNQENKTLDDAQLYQDLKNATSDDHTYSGLETEVTRS